MSTTVDENLVAVFKACQKSFVAVGIFSGVANLLMLVPAFFMLNVYDKAVGNNSLATLWVLSSITAFLFLMLFFMEAVRSRVLVLVSSRLDNMLAPLLYDLTFNNAVLVGGRRASNQPLVDLNGLRQFVTGNGIFAFFDAPWLPIYIWVLFVFHPLLGWMGVLASVVFFAIAVMNQKRSAPPLESASEVARQCNYDVQRNLRNAEAVSAMGMLPALRLRWRNRQDEMLAMQEKASGTAGTFSAGIKTLRIAIQSSAIAAGAFLVLRQEISPGMLIAGSILIGRALAPVESAVGAWKGFVDAKGQYDRIKKVLSNVVTTSNKTSLPPISGNILARSATIVPPGSRKPTISGATFDIPSGAVCMISGPSGAGKSTLVRGLLGLWPTQMGELRIDGIETSKFNREEVGPQLGYLPQAIELLEGTVSENIARFSEVDSAAVIKAAKDAGLHEFILSLANGYDTDLGNPGGELSPGQQQRLALARAIYGYPKVVVLDEPNSNLDDVGEAALRSVVQRLKEVKSTVIIVSHRTNILPLADFLIMLSAGRVVDFGETKEVVARIQAQQNAKQHALANANKIDKTGNSGGVEPRDLTVPVNHRSKERDNGN